MVLKAINDESEIAKIHKQIKKQLDERSHQKIKTDLGFQGVKGQNLNEVSYSEELKLWWMIEEDFQAVQKKYRFFNAFGVNRPQVEKGANTDVQINYDENGSTNRAGLLAKDDDGTYYLLHSGGLGGGIPGLTKDFFFDNYKNEIVNVAVDGKVNSFALVGEVGSQRFPEQLALFVSECKRIKEKNKRQADPTISSTSNKIQFNPEFSGLKAYGLSSTVVASADHGLVVNGLFAALKILKFNPGNSRNMDLYFQIGDSEKETVLFEVKTNLESQTLLTGIGQLMYYSLAFFGHVSKFYVLPTPVSQKLIEDLDKLGIEVIEYHWVSNKPVFVNLEEKMERFLNA